MYSLLVILQKWIHNPLKCRDSISNILWIANNLSGQTYFGLNYARPQIYSKNSYSYYRDFREIKTPSFTREFVRLFISMWRFIFLHARKYIIYCSWCFKRLLSSFLLVIKPLYHGNSQNHFLNHTLYQYFTTFLYHPWQL